MITQFDFETQTWKSMRFERDEIDISKTFGSGKNEKMHENHRVILKS